MNDNHKIRLKLKMKNKLKESPLELSWTREIKEGISNVVFAEGNIVVGTKNGELKCFDLKSNLKWESVVPNENNCVSS